MITEDGASSQASEDWLQDAQEQRVIYAALDSFCAYRRTCHYNITHVRRQSFYALPTAQWTMLAAAPFNYLRTLDEVDKCIDANARIAEAIVRHAIPAFGLGTLKTGATEEGPTEDSDDPVIEANSSSAEPWAGTSNGLDRDKARSTIRQLYRDWSADGAAEREVCYDPVLREIEATFASHSDAEKAAIKILVPGAGLGRLLVEIVKAGYTAEGNEISYHQLMASNFILNGLKESQYFSLYPFALSFSNHMDRGNQLRRITIPDEHPGVALTEASRGKPVHAFERMSMSAADFCVSYKKEQNRDEFDVVATVFFLDTAPNLISYIEAVRNCLKPNGLWINNGPLTWHFENNPPGGSEETEEDKQHKSRPVSSAQGPQIAEDSDRGIAEPGSFELSEDEVVALVGRYGFTIEKHSWSGRRTGYIQDDRSMLLNEYRPVFWVARKL